MAINFEKTYGVKNNAAAAASSNERPKAQLWLNVGYLSDALDDNGERRFVSLPTGIPLDTQERLDTRSRNREFAQFQAARNDLLDQILKQGEQLKAGESVVLETASGLAIQVRRINEELEETNVSDGNAFARKLFG